jgi:hypothetical protein
MRKNTCILSAGLLLAGVAVAADKGSSRYPLPYPPSLPDGKALATDTSEEFLKPGGTLKPDVEIAKTPPRIDFMFMPDQNYPGNPWSFRAMGCVAGNKYYTAVCDHLAPLGNVNLYEYDGLSRTFRRLMSTTACLREAGILNDQSKYSPGEIQSRIDLGSDGWLYYATDRGSPTVSDDAHGYKGEHILRTDPQSGQTRIVYSYPVDRHTIPASILDPDRMILYGGTSPGKDATNQNHMFFALDVRSGKLLKTAEGGFDRYVIFAKSTGCLYWDGHKYDPDTGLITTSVAPHVRSASVETPRGIVYGTSHTGSTLWAFDVRKETLAVLGEGAVASQTYIASVQADPTGRYLYYVPGAHGGASRDNSPVVQYDLKTGRRKVLAFLHDYYWNTYQYAPDGTFCVVLDPRGDKLYIGWDGWRKGQPRGWESAAMMVIHIPPSERP